MAGSRCVEAQVALKKQELLKYNPWANTDPSRLEDRVFCLCTRCTVQPLMLRSVMSLRRTAYAHREVDVSNKLVDKAALLKANGSLTVVPFGDFFKMYTYYVQGKADENGLLLPGEQLDEQVIGEVIDTQTGEPEWDTWGGDSCSSPIRRSGITPAPDMSPGKDLLGHNCCTRR